jgi:NADH oxidase (H2O2-forming)
VESVSLDDSDSPIGADLVIIATGVAPDTALAEKTGMEIGELGGLVTDGRQRPKMNGKFLEDIYALGDCVEVKNRLTASNTLSPLTETAIVQARIIAMDIMGRELKPRNEIEKGYVCSSLTVVGNLQIGMTGLTTAEAKKAGIQPKSLQISGWSKEVYFPGKTRKHIKLLINDDRLIGAQLVGKEGIKGLINEINVLIRASVRIEDILCRQRGYTPALSSSPDVLMRALEKLSA